MDADTDMYCEWEEKQDRKVWGVLGAVNSTFDRKTNG